MPDALKMLGLAYKAGRVVLGATAVKQAIKQGKAVLLLIAADASGNTVRRAKRWILENRIRLLTLPHDKATLGRALGRPECALAALTDISFAEAITNCR